MQRKHYSDEHILESLRLCYTEEKAISQNIYSKSGHKPSVDAISARFGSWSKALKIAGLPVNERRVKVPGPSISSKYSKEEIIGQLQRCYRENGEISMSLYSKRKYKPGRTTIILQFGSWNAALEAAQLAPFQPKKRAFSDEDIFKQLYECYKENNNFISIDIYADSGRSPKISTIIKYFGSWNKAIKLAGLNPNDSNIVDYTDEDFINSLWNCYRENNGYIASTIYYESGIKPGLTAVKKRFGTWNKALEFAGIPINVQPRKEYSKENIIDILNDFYVENGDISRDIYLESGQLPHLNTIINYFGSWENALKEAQVNADRNRKQYTKEDVITSIQNCYKDFNRPISITDYRDKNYKPKVATIRRLFGSWKQAVEKAGIPQFSE